MYTRFLGEPQGIDRKVSFQETPMGMCLDERELDLLRRHPQVHPRRHLSHLEIGIAIEQELADDLLHPCRASLRIRTDDDVVVAKLEVVPDRRVHVVVVKLTLLPGLIRLTHESSPVRGTE